VTSVVILTLVSHGQAQPATATRSFAACCGPSPVSQAAPDLQEEPRCVRSCPYRQTRILTSIWESSDASGTLAAAGSSGLPSAGSPSARELPLRLPRQSSIRKPLSRPSPPGLLMVDKVEFALGGAPHHLRPSVLSRHLVDSVHDIPRGCLMHHVSCARNGL
jgi:hypothetical protein